MANQKKKRRKKKLGKWKRKRGRKENASKKKFCRALVEDSVDSDNGWTFSSAGNSSLRTSPPPFPPSSSPPLQWRAPLLTPSLCQFSCQNFVRILIFLLFSLSPFFIFFFVFFFVAFYGLENAGMGLPSRAGAGQVLWLGRRHSLVAFKCDSLIFVFFAVIPRQIIWICMESRRTPCCHVRGGGDGGGGAWFALLAE